MTRARRVPLVALAAAVAVLMAGCSSPDGTAPPTAAATESAPAPTPTVAPYDADFAALEQTFGSRLGVYAIDTGTGREIAYRADERFAYASTFKALAAAAVLQQNDLADLDRVVSFTAADLITYSPVTEKNVETGMSLGAIAEAAVRYSDNTAGNLLLDELGGPAGFGTALAAVGDQVTQPVRWEAGLNDAVPGDPRDTTSPRAFATDLREFALGDALTDEKQTVLVDWMTGNATGSALIRAGVPADWAVADKSGSGGYGVRNNIAIVWPPDSAPIVVAILSTRDSPDATRDDALIAQAATAVVDALQ
ncbi:class A beta-lactamase [Conyzicola sp.]|uniref:class A beta-lactamase n=1 Tax=Conyzicola sp. TaxID=1969404 RepID=UPI0039894B39